MARSSVPYFSLIKLSLISGEKLPENRKFHQNLNFTKRATLARDNEPTVYFTVPNLTLIGALVALNPTFDRIFKFDIV